MSHKTCCSKYKRPRTVAQFAALCYPANPAGHDDIKNRIHNPEEDSVAVHPHWKYQWDEATGKYKRDANGKKKISNSYKLRHGWWFRLDPTKVTHLLDGSGDQTSRGEVITSRGVKANDPNDRLVCFNACCLKELIPPGGGPPVPHGFTWHVALRGKVPAGKDHPDSGSGWIPLSSIKLDDEAKNRPKVMDSLKNWACCINRYKTWGRSLAKPGSTLYKFRSVESLEEELDNLAKGKVKLATYFTETKKGSVRKILKQCDGKQSKLRKKIGIHPSCFNGNKLTDYLPKGFDFKNGWYEKGYTNFVANISIGKDKPRMAPIGLDTFPAGHDFHRLKFKGDKKVLGFIYKVPGAANRPGKRIGRVVWFFGYCDIESSDPSKKQRRYGWVPALAVRRP